MFSEDLRRLLSSVLIVQGLIMPRAFAEGDVKYERAKVLFQEGRRLMFEGRHREACEHFEQSLTLEEAIGTQFNLAACWESLGRTASAQALFAKVAAEAESQGQEPRAQVARERVAVLEPRLSRLLIDVEAVIPNLQIERNSQRVDASTWGAPVPVDPGVYELRASAPGKVPWVKRVSVGAVQSLVWVSVPPLSEQPKRGATECARPEPSAPSARSASSAPLRPGPEPETLHVFRPVALGLTVLGLGGLAAGSAFALKYRSANDEAEGICRETPTCPRDAIERYQDLTQNARASRTGAFISFGLGGAALVGAAVTYFGVPLYHREGQIELSARPVYTLDGSWGLAAGGAF